MQNLDEEGKGRRFELSTHMYLDGWTISFLHRSNVHEGVWLVDQDNQKFVFHKFA